MTPSVWFALILLACGTLSACMALYLWRNAQAISRIPVRSIATLNDGYVAFVGSAEAMAGRSVRARFSAEPCVWFKCVAEDYVSMGGGDRRTWQIIETVASDADFSVRDSTGSILVSPIGAIDEGFESTVWAGEPRHDGIVDEIMTKTFSTRPSLDRRFREYIISSGMPIYVVGELSAGQVKKPRSGPFLISAIMPEVVARRAVRLALGLNVFAFVTLLAGLILMRS